jgi:hypothetical protein
MQTQRDVYTARGTPTLRLGIADIIRTIFTYFVVLSETPNAKHTRGRSEMRMTNIDDTIDP